MTIYLKPFLGTSAITTIALLIPSMAIAQSVPTAANNSSPSAAQGQPVLGLVDLVGAKGGQAENTVVQRGYELRRSAKQADSSFTYWLERGTGNCVAIRTTDGRYAAIAYTADQDCNR